MDSRIGQVLYREQQGVRFLVTISFTKKPQAALAGDEMQKRAVTAMELPTERQGAFLFVGMQ